MTKRPRRRTWCEDARTDPRGVPRPARLRPGYLHQDFEEVHGSLRAAADAFRADASPAEREQLVQELVSLTALVADLPARLLRQFIEELGGGWMPKSKEEIAELLEAMRAR